MLKGVQIRMLNELAIEIAKRLNDITPGWSAEGNGVHGPRNVGVELTDFHHEYGPGHVDIGFVLGCKSQNCQTIWDCVSGYGSSVLERVQSAAHVWVTCTAPVFLELIFSGRGDYAEHYHAADPEGLRGWHAIHGPILGIGQEGAEILQKWWLENPLLPLISRNTKNSDFGDLRYPHGIKLLFGGEDVAEVRIDGMRHEPASQALLLEKWPRVARSFVRGYILAMHPE
jgi:hypothetical protein